MLKLCCTVECKELADPANGQVSVVRFTARYSCDFGYTLNGDNSRFCQIDGNWSGSHPACTLDALIGSVVAITVTLLLTVVSVVVCCVLYRQKRCLIRPLVEPVETDIRLSDRPRYVVCGYVVTA